MLVRLSARHGACYNVLSRNPSEVPVLETGELARKIVDAVLNKQALNILLLDLKGVCSFADYFVICTGESERQLQAICKEIDETLAAIHLPLRQYQGTPDSGWLILDLDSIVVHVFLPEQRAFYALEELWKNAATVLKIL